MYTTLLVNKIVNKPVSTCVYDI